MKKIFTKEFYIGLWVIVAIAILIVGIDYLKGINIFKPANFYIAEYANVQGLEVSAPVTIDGFKVGQVREINFDYQHPGKIEVILALNKNLNLPVDSKACIESTLLSGAYVNIKMGKSPKMLEIGGTVKSEATSDLMSKVSDEIMPTINSILPKVDSLLASLNTLVSDPALAQSIHRIDGITDNVLLASMGLKKTLDSDVPRIMGSAGRVTTNLDSITCNLSALSASLRALPIESTMDNVEAVTANLNRFSTQLNDKNSTLGRLTNDPELYERINRVAADVDSLIVDIKKNPKRYISIKLL